MKKTLLIFAALCLVCFGAFAAEGEWIIQENIELEWGSLCHFSDEELRKIAPDGKTAWTSSNEKAATVDRWGNVQAGKPDALSETFIIAERDGVSYTWKATVRPLSQEIVLYVNGEEAENISLDLDAGETGAQIKAVVLPEGAAQDVEFSVGGGAVIDENGFLTVTDDGKYTVTVRAQDRGKANAQMEIAALHPVQKIALGAQPIVTAGCPMQIEAVLTPDNATIRRLIWTSSDESIATVDKNGVVTGMQTDSAKECIITAEAADGSGISGAWSVTVVPAAQKIELLFEGEAFPNQSIILDDSMVGQILEFGANVYPADADQRVKWSSGNKSIIKVDENGRIGVAGRGTCKLTLQTTDGAVKKVIDVAVQNIDDYPYYVEIDKGNQVVRIYEKDERGMYSVLSRRMVCSTGVHDNAFANGIYDVDSARKEWMGTILDGVYCQYGVRFYDMIWFHSLPYQGTNPARMDMGAYAQLGTKASHGCIRLLTADAKWIHDNVRGGSLITVCKCERVESEYGAVSWPEAQGGWDPTDPNEKNPYFDPNYTSAVTKE